MVFNIDNYKGHFAMHCATAREAKEFCDYLHSLEKSWKSKESYCMVTNWSIFKNETCYCFNDGIISSLTFCKRDGYAILEWSDFITKFTKSDLRDGMVVKTAQDEPFLVHKGRFVNYSGWLNISNYTDNLEDPTDARFTINKVYEVKALSSFNHLFNPGFMDLVWEREDMSELMTKPKPIEMTLEEICKELGREIKIVKDKKGV